MFGVMWLQKFSHKQDWLLLLLWHGAESSQTRMALLPLGTWSSWVWGHVRRWMLVYITIACDHLKHHDLEWVLGFHYYRYCMDRASWRLFLFTIWLFQKFFSSEKNQGMFSWKRCLSFLKCFAVEPFLLSFIVCDKNWSFLIFYEKY